MSKTYTHKYVKIVSCRSSKWWYKNMLNEVRLVKDFGGDDDYHCTIELGEGYISKKDCKDATDLEIALIEITKELKASYK